MAALDRRDSIADDNDDGSQADSPSGSKDGPTASKDRECPYCHQSFTSSSLGRHLDLYIKEKNPKAPDGVHNVDEIRKMRSKITRRHPRQSAATKAHKMDVSRTEDSPQAVHIAQGASSNAFSQPDFQSVPHVSEAERQPMHKVNWHATGVMSNLPPRIAGQAGQEQGRNWQQHSPSVQSPINLDVLKQSREDRVAAKAAECALKEIIHAVQIANSRVNAKPLFDYDFFSMNFPALCLQLLPPPAMIFTSTPAHDPESWPLLPPSRQTFEVTTSALNNKLQTAAGADVDPQLYRAHLHRTFEHWETLTPQHKHEAWQLEIMRDLAKSKQRCKVAEDTNERHAAELEHLRSVIDGVPEIRQHGHWFAHPAYVPCGPFPYLSSNIASQLTDIDQWNFDRMMSKWKTTMTDGSEAKSVQVQPSQQHTPSETSRMQAHPHIQHGVAQPGSYLSNIGQIFASASPRPGGRNAPEMIQRDEVMENGIQRH